MRFSALLPLFAFTGITASTPVPTNDAVVATEDLATYTTAFFRLEGITSAEDGKANVNANDGGIGRWGLFFEDNYMRGRVQLLQEHGCYNFDHIVRSLQIGNYLCTIYSQRNCKGAPLLNVLNAPWVTGLRGTGPDFRGSYACVWQGPGPK